MTHRIGDHWDYQLRQSVLDSAVASNKKGAKAEKIIKDAEKFYGFLLPENWQVIDHPSKRGTK